MPVTHLPRKTPRKPLCGTHASKRQDTLEDTMTTPKTSYLLLPAGLALGLLGAGCHVSHAEYVGTGTPGPSTIVAPEVEVNDFEIGRASCRERV